MAYYIMMTATEALAERGLLLAWVATWIPNGFFLLVGVYLLILRALEKRSRIAVRLDWLVAAIMGRVKLGT